MSNTPTQKTGLFIVKYRLDKGEPGAPSFEIALAVNTVDKAVSGVGHITQATNPPLNEGTRLSGSYTYMTIMPQESHILVIATGVASSPFPPNGGPGPALPPPGLLNVDLRMVLSDNWKQGVASYRYRVGGEWREAEDVPVRMIAD